MKTINSLTALLLAGALTTMLSLTGCIEKETTKEVPNDNPPVVNNVQPAPSKPDVTVNVPPSGSAPSAPSDAGSSGDKK
jgi:hypothetical protein